MSEKCYLRAIPGRSGYAAVCQKPQYDKAQIDSMRETEQTRNFQWLMAEAKRQYNDPVLRKEWAQKHKEALEAISKHGRRKYRNGRLRVPVRLWDYIRREIAKKK